MNHHKLYKHCKILSFIFVLFLAISCGAKDIVFDSYTGQAMYSGYNPYGPPYGAEVKCDSGLPMDELRQCITDSYLAMDKKRMTPWEKFERDEENMYKEKYSQYKEYNFPDTHTITYNEVPEFKSIKECYEKDKCFVKGSIRDLSYDDYKRQLAVEHIDSISGVRPDEKCTREPRLKICVKGESFGLGRYFYRHFTRSYRSKKKDMINFYDGELNVYTADIEVVRLKNDKKLIAVRIIEFRPMNPEKEGFYSISNTTYERFRPGLNGLPTHILKESAKKHLSLSGAFTIWDIREDDIQEMSDNLAISLDKREYPTKIYINTGAKVYEVPIPKEEDKIQNK